MMEMMVWPLSLEPHSTRPSTNTDSRIVPSSILRIIKGLD
jgi:hypothetical protein